MSQPTPELFIDTVFAYQKTAAIKAAIDLGLFTAIGKDAKPVQAISQDTGAAARGVRILCDYLTVQGFLNKVDGRYQLTCRCANMLKRRDLQILLRSTQASLPGSLAQCQLTISPGY
jgi:hypothetical protein